MRLVTRLCSPPLFLNSFLTIQLAAEPQTISKTSRRAEAQPFQKDSKAVMKSERGVSNQGISSMKTTFFSRALDLTTSLSSSNASIQSTRGRLGVLPYSRRELTNWRSCFFIPPFASPECWKANFSEKTLRIRNVFPTRRRPYTATNSDSEDL